MSEEKEEKKDKGGFFEGVLTGLGAALGLAALGIGGKMLYDDYKNSTEKDEIIEKEKEEKDVDEDEKQKDLENSEKYISSSINTSTEYDDITGKDSFICPINQTIMSDPVITPYGTTYERSAILDWLKKNDTDPLTKKKLTEKMLITNYALKSAIEEYKQSLKK